jgi:hypothetical protein
MKFFSSIAAFVAVILTVPAAAQDLLWSLQGSSPGEQFGRALAVIGDIDGDGVGDLAIGIPGSDVAGSDAGEVRVVSGANGALLRVAYGQNPGDAFGGDVAWTGDVNGDGVSDLIVGATTDAKFQGAYGGQYARVLSGADGSLIHHLVSPNSFTFRFGFSVHGAGDLNGDGRGDLVVGAPDFEPECPFGWWCNGAAWVFSGSDASVLYAVTSGATEWTPGYDVGGGRDLNGDGVPEWLVGNPDYFGEGNFNGHAWLYDGATGVSVGDFTDPLNNPDRYGRLVEFVGDVDGDGVEDMLFCQGEWGFTYTFGAGGPKRTHLVSGATHVLIRTIPDTYDSAAAVGELDGDGRDEVLLGHGFGNRSELRSGLNAKNLLGVVGSGAGDGLGMAVEGLGDLDHDGFVDFAVGAPQRSNGGTGYVWVVKGRQDCNGDGIADALQLAAGALADCDDNGLPDGCEIAAGTAEDCNADGVPDVCQYGPSTDCNDNGVLDACDILSGTSNDFDGDGVPDECQCSSSTYCVAAPNSFSTGGAHIGWSGSPSVTLNQWILEADGAVPGQIGIFFLGLNETQSPFGEGWLCITGGIQRINQPVFVDGAGHGELQTDFGDPLSPLSALQGGDTRRFQFWYRDPQPVGYGFNLSDGLEIQLCP